LCPHREKRRGGERAMVCFNPPQSCTGRTILFDNLEMKSHRIPWNIGIMEHWSNGKKEDQRPEKIELFKNLVFGSFPLFHRSNIPLFHF
jgi:hypothetical protein